jgi:predicted DCC family thiol-disulfide oxidoreductase YuxK
MTGSSIAFEAPEMADRQHGEVLVYDGDCGFCARCAQWARRRLPQGHEVVAWQQLPDLDALGLTAADVASAAYWIDAAGQPHRGEQGVAMALIEIGGFWTVVGRTLLMPPVRTMAAPLYRLIARNRHRMPGGSVDCQVDDGAQGDMERH